MTRDTLPALIAALLGAIAVHSPLSAQAAVDGRLLRTGVDTFSVSYSGQRIGTGVMARSRLGDVQRAQLLQVYVWRGAGGDVVVDSLVSDLATLRPIREVRVAADTVVDAAFGEDSIRLTLRAASGAARRRAVQSRPAIYSSASIEALAAAAPLGSGFQQSVQVYYAPPSPRGFVEIPMHVAGAEQVNDRSGASRDAWIVNVATPDGGTTYWIDKETRAILQYDVREGPAKIEFRR